MNETLTFNNTVRTICFEVDLVSDLAMELEGQESFILELSNPVTMDVAHVEFPNGTAVTVVITDVNGGLTFSQISLKWSVRANWVLLNILTKYRKAFMSKFGSLQNPRILAKNHGL